MFGFLLTPLMTTLSPHFDLSKTRLETLAIMLIGLANGRTVNHGHLASQFPGIALHASSYRRLQRFFQHVRRDGDVVARLIARLLDLKDTVMGRRESLTFRLLHGWRCGVVTMMQ